MLRPWSYPRALTNTLLVVVLTLAAGLRLWNLGAAEFKYDEARLCTLAADFVDTGIPPQRGMGSSTGIDNPPLAVYLMALPVLLSRDPLFATAFVALLNVVAVYGCYCLGRRYWSPFVGLAAAALLAVSPWAVFYSRKVWAQNLLLPWTLLFFASLLAWMVEHRRWALAWAIVLLTALTQIHFAAVAFVPVFMVVVVVVWIDRAHQHKAHTLWAPLALGVGAGLLLYLPYLLFDASHGWGNVRAVLVLLRQPPQTHWEAIRFALLNTGGREIHSLAGQRFQHFLEGIVDLSYWPDRVEEALAVASLAYLLVRCVLCRRGNSRWQQDSLLVLWLVVPVAFFLWQRSEIHPHYLLPLYPAPYLALAIVANDALAAARRLAGPGHVPQQRNSGAIADRSVRAAHSDTGKAAPLRAAVSPQANPPRIIRLDLPGGAQALATALLVLLIAWQCYLSLSIHGFVNRYDTPGGMGTPIRIYRQVLQSMVQQAEAYHNRQVVVLCEGDDPRLDECPAVFAFIASRALQVRLVNRNSALLFPSSAQDTLVVLIPGDSRAATELPAYAREIAGVAVPLREGVGYYRFYRLSAGYAPIPPVQPRNVPVRLANGVSLQGYALSHPLTPGQPARLALYWHVDSLPHNPPPQGYSFANHLLAADGERFAQQDGPGYDVRLWQSGDSIISWFDVPLPAELPSGPYRLQVSMYIYTPPDQYETVSSVNGGAQETSGVVAWPLE